MQADPYRSIEQSFPPDTSHDFLMASCAQARVVSAAGGPGHRL